MRTKANVPIQFQTANGNTKGVKVVTMNIVEFWERRALSDTPCDHVRALLVGDACVRDITSFGCLESSRISSPRVVN